MLRRTNDRLNVAAAVVGTSVVMLGLLYAAFARSEQVVQNTRDIRKLEEIVAQDHDILIRVDARVGAIHDQLKRMEAGK
jgi:hypothetical protein